MIDLDLEWSWENTRVAQLKDTDKFYKKMWNWLMKERNLTFDFFTLIPIWLSKKCNGDKHIVMTQEMAEFWVEENESNFQEYMTKLLKIQREKFIMGLMGLEVWVY